METTVSNAMCERVVKRDARIAAHKGSWYVQLEGRTFTGGTRSEAVATAAADLQRRLEGST